MLTWLAAYADLISGVLGVTGSIVLSVPAIQSVRHKRRYERFSDVTQRSGQTTEEPMRGPKQSLTDAQLRGSRPLLLWNLLGNALLLAAFAFLIVAGVERRNSLSSTEAHLGARITTPPQG